MEQGTNTEARRYRAFGRHHLNKLLHISNISREQQVALEAVSAVLPFRVNSYVLDELIDWDNIPNDPIYQLTFPQAGMLPHHDFLLMQDLVVSGASKEEISRAAHEIQRQMNPHPAGQTDLNVPIIDGQPLVGSQHKYRETMLFFPSQGQTCHAFCTYCFRWAQFVGLDNLTFANHEVTAMVRYLQAHPEISDILFTGGDPLIMSTAVLRRYIEPLLSSHHDHLVSIRIGTKSLAYWPYRFTSDRDADDLLRLFEQVVKSGRQLALMAHFSHPKELQTNAVQKAIRRIVDTGAVIRCQAPLVRHVNDDADTWATLWKEQVRAGTVPYYMFVERDTGPKHYFEIPLGRALRIFSDAYGKVSGLARTVRGPSMSATPGKVLVDGVANVGGEKVFVLKMIQGREPSWSNQIFFARFDSQAAWLDELEPAGSKQEFFFAPYLRAMKDGLWMPSWTHDSEPELELQVC
jgi:KamA family protein